MQLGPKYKLVGVGGLGVGEDTEISVLGIAMWVMYRQSMPANNLSKGSVRAGDSYACLIRAVCAFCSSPPEEQL